MDRGLVEHLDEPAMNLCLYGFLCIFGIQYMYGKSSSSSLVCMPNEVIMRTDLWLSSTSNAKKSVRLYVGFLCQYTDVMSLADKENLSRWWGEDRENPRDEPLSLDQALARSRREVHSGGFPILTSSTWLIIYLAYFLSKPHFNQMFVGLQSIWHIYRVGKCRLTSPSDVITTCVRTHSRTSNV